MLLLNSRIGLVTYFWKYKQNVNTSTLIVPLNRHVYFKPTNVDKIVTNWWKSSGQCKVVDYIIWHIIGRIFDNCSWAMRVEWSGVAQNATQGQNKVQAILLNKKIHQLHG